MYYIPGFLSAGATELVAMRGRRYAYRIYVRYFAFPDSVHVSHLDGDSYRFEQFHYRMGSFRRDTTITVTDWEAW